MRKRWVAAGLAVVLGSGVAAIAIAQVKPEVLVKQRQAAMTLQGKYFGPLGGMLKGTIPYDASVVARNAEYLNVLAMMPWDGFVESTKGETSRVLPAMWTESAKFKLSQDQFQTSIAALVAAYKGGNEETVKAAIGDVGKACGSCHDNFREK